MEDNDKKSSEEDKPTGDRSSEQDEDVEIGEIYSEASIGQKRVRSGEQIKEIKRVKKE